METFWNHDLITVQQVRQVTFQFSESITDSIHSIVLDLHVWLTAEVIRYHKRPNSLFVSLRLHSLRWVLLNVHWPLTRPSSNFWHISVKRWHQSTLHSRHGPHGREGRRALSFTRPPCWKQTREWQTHVHAHVRTHTHRGAISHSHQSELRRLIFKGGGSRPSLKADTGPRQNLVSPTSLGFSFNASRNMASWPSARQPKHCGN